MIPELYELAQLQATIAQNPHQWRPLVFTCGCFDLLHAGHVRYLRAARALGQALVVGLNSDYSVRHLKPQKLGNLTRPIVSELQRAEVLAALKPVDGIVLYDDLTADRVIAALQPEIYAKGGDYHTKPLPESTTVQSYGGKISLIDIEVPASTTAIIETIVRGAGL